MSEPALDVQAITASWSLAYSSTGPWVTSGRAAVVPAAGAAVCGVAGVCARAKQAQSRRTAAKVNDFIIGSPSSGYDEWLTYAKRGLERRLSLQRMREPESGSSETGNFLVLKRFCGL